MVDDTATRTAAVVGILMAPIAGMGVEWLAEHVGGPLRMTTRWKLALGILWTVLSVAALTLVFIGHVMAAVCLTVASYAAPLIPVLMGLLRRKRVQPEPANRQWIGHPVTMIHVDHHQFSLREADTAHYLHHLLAPRIIGTKARAYYASGWMGLSDSKFTEYTIAEQELAGDTLRVKVKEPIEVRIGDKCETLALLYGFDGNDGTVGITGDAHLAVNVTENKLREEKNANGLSTGRRILEVRFTMRPATPINVSRVRLEWSPPGRVETHGDRIEIQVDSVRPISPCRLDLTKDESAEFLLSPSGVGGDGRIVVIAGGIAWVSDWFVISRGVDPTPRPA